MFFKIKNMKGQKIPGGGGLIRRMVYGPTIGPSRPWSDHRTMVGPWSTTSKPFIRLGEGEL